MYLYSSEALAFVCTLVIMLIIIYIYIYIYMLYMLCLSYIQFTRTFTVPLLWLQMYGAALITTVAKKIFPPSTMYVNVIWAYGLCISIIIILRPNVHTASELCICILIIMIIHCTYVL